MKAAIKNGRYIDFVEGRLEQLGDLESILGPAPGIVYLTSAYRKVLAEIAEISSPEKSHEKLIVMGAELHALWGSAIDSGTPEIARQAKYEFYAVNDIIDLGSGRRTLESFGSLPEFQGSSQSNPTPKQDQYNHRIWS